MAKYRDPDPVVTLRPSRLSIVEKIVLFFAMIVSIMACQQVSDPKVLRTAHYDPAQYFDNDRLRVDTVNACHAGTDRQQLAWAGLDACRTAKQADLAKRSGWKPATGASR